MATTPTARPARTRAARTTKATPAKAATTKAEAIEEAPEVEAYVIDLEHIGDTVKYAKFAPPEGHGCVGTLYFPLGTKAAKVKFSG